MKAHSYVTISKRVSGGWQVRAKHFSGDMNQMDTLLAQRDCRTEASARRVAQEYAKEYRAEILN